MAMSEPIGPGDLADRARYYERQGVDRLAAIRRSVRDALNAGGDGSGTI